MIDILKELKTNSKRQVFDRVFKEHREQVLDLCVRITGNRTDGEDAFQDTMIDLYNGLTGFKGLSKLSTWIHRIAIRASLRVRAKRKVPVCDLPEGVQSKSNPSHMEEKEEVIQVLKAMDQLPMESRLVLHLFALKNLSHSQISEVLGIPEGTVWSRLHRARSQLVEKIKHQHKTG